MYINMPATGPPSGSETNRDSDEVTILGRIPFPSESESKEESTPILVRKSFRVESSFVLGHVRLTSLRY